MLRKHITKLMQDMNNHGSGYAHGRCYEEKIATYDQAYLLGFLDACSSIREYISHHRLDKSAKGCYTRRKAHKK